MKDRLSYNRENGIQAFEAFLQIKSCLKMAEVFCQNNFFKEASKCIGEADVNCKVLLRVVASTGQEASKKRDFAEKCSPLSAQVNREMTRIKGTITHGVKKIRCKINKVKRKAKSYEKADCDDTVCLHEDMKCILEVLDGALHDGLFERIIVRFYMSLNIPYYHWLQREEKYTCRYSKSQVDTTKRRRRVSNDN